MAAGVRAASLAEVKSVYLFPMSNGMDQYLADRLTRDHVFQVVTDPKAADAIITDKLGEGFETELLRLRPELKPPPPKKAVADKDKKDDDKDKKDEKAADDLAAPINTFHTAHGTIFIVHVRAQQVVWSTYQHPPDHSPKEMELTAVKISGLLMKDLAPPVPGAKTKK